MSMTHWDMTKDDWFITMVCAYFIPMAGNGGQEQGTLSMEWNYGRLLEVVHGRGMK